LAVCETFVAEATRRQVHDGSATYGVGSEHYCHPSVAYHNPSVRRRGQICYREQHPSQGRHTCCSGLVARQSHNLRQVCHQTCRVRRRECQNNQIGRAQTNRSVLPDDRKTQLLADSGLRFVNTCFQTARNRVRCDFATAGLASNRRHRDQAFAPYAAATPRDKSETGAALPTDSKRRAAPFIALRLLQISIFRDVWKGNTRAPVHLLCPCMGISQLLKETGKTSDRAQRGREKRYWTRAT
jgi:hypothetical protein